MAFAVGERHLGITKGSIDLVNLAHGEEDHKLKSYLQHLQVIHNQKHGKQKMKEATSRTGNISPILHRKPSLDEMLERTSTSNTSERNSDREERRVTMKSYSNARSSVPLHSSVSKPMRAHFPGHSTDNISRQHSSAPQNPTKAGRMQADLHSKKGSKHRDHPLSQIDLTTATSLSGYSPGSKKKHQHPLELHTSRYRPHHYPAAQSNGYQHHSLEKATSVSQPQKNKARADQTPFDSQPELHFPASFPNDQFPHQEARVRTSDTPAEAITELGAPETTGEAVSSDHLSACIDDLSERVQQLSVVFTQERNSLVYKLLKLG